MTDEKMTRTGALRAAVAGGEAQRAGKPVTDCPHQATSPDPAARFLAHHWVRGWTAAATA
ncbi:MAG TPA: Rmf/CrpP family protein [Phytomonospora sp.]